jgi:hypothetical protein
VQFFQRKTASFGGWLRGRDMADKREKSVSYRRAEWFADASGLTLEKCIRDANKSLPTVDARTINRSGQHTSVAKVQDVSSGGLYLHITADTPGEAASAVPKAKPGATVIDLKTEKPPPGSEWLDGDAFLYVKPDHVCMCSTGIRDGAIGYFLHELFKKAQLRKDSIRFELMKAADISKLRLLHSQGVKEFEIKATLYKATAEYEQRKTQVTGTLGLIGKHLKRAFLNKPNDVTSDGLRVMLTLKVDKRFAKAFSLGQKRIEALAADVVRNTEDHDEYVIVTKTGQKISPKEIFMSSKVLIDSEGKTVDRDKAWAECSHFFSLLKDSGAIEQ